MENDGAKNVDDLEKKVGELEDIADALGEAPDEELVETLDWAVSLLKEINAGIEAGLEEATSETRDLGALLDGVSFGPFDEALEELEKRERETDGP
ncbi:MAG: hypothetical protein ACRDSJ_02805 [Rubrobacteraceae bacterium]